MAMFMKTLYTPGLAHLSYILGDGGQASVIDPRRDVNEYLEIAHRRGAKITHIFASPTSLWRGRARQWETWAILRAVLGFIVFGLIVLVRGAILEFVMQAALCGSLVLVLTGESKRTRTWVAIGIYVIGYVGLLLLSFVIGFLKGAGVL